MKGKTYSPKERADEKYGLVGDKTPLL